VNSDSAKLKDHGRATDWRFTRLVVAIGLYAAAVGASAVLVSFIVRSTPWDWSEPGRLPAIQATYFAGAGSVGAVIMSIPVVYWLSQRARAPSNLFWWWGMGLFFGFVAPVVTGGVFPFASLLLGYAQGLIDAGTLLGGLHLSFWNVPFSAVINGTRDMVTWLLAGAIFGTGGWVIDNLHAHRMDFVNVYCPWLAALILGTCLVAIAAFGPIDVLASLG